MIVIKTLKDNLLRIGFCIAFFAISCIHLPYFFENQVSITSDYLFHLSRIENIYRNIKVGIFLPTIDQANMNGLGYLIDVYYPNLFYYLPALLRFFLPISIALQISIVLYNFVFMISYYKVSYKIFKNKLFSVSFSIIYIASYYLFIDLVSRQAISEYFSALIFPLVIFGVYSLIENKNWKLLFISMSLVAYTHMLSLVLYSAIIVMYLIFDYKKLDKEIIFNLIKAGFLSVLVSSSFLIPFVYYIRKDNYMVSGNFNKLLTINSAYDLIYVFLFVFIFVISFIIYNAVLSKKNVNRVLLFSIIGFVISLYIHSSLCNWEVLSFFSVFQYKIRIGLLINIFACLIFASIVPKKHAIVVCSVALFWLIITQSMMSSVYDENIAERLAEVGQTYEERIVEEIDRDAFLISKDAMFLDKYCEIVFGEYIPDRLVFNGIDFTKYLEENSIIYNAEVVMEEDFEDIEQFKKNNKYILNSSYSEMIIDKIYYPLYNVKQENNKEIDIESYNGLVKITNISDGDIILSYANTPLQIISLLITIVTLICIYLRKEKIWQEKK